MPNGIRCIVWFDKPKMGIETSFWMQTILNHKNMSQKDLYNLIKENSKEPVAEYQINRICKGVVTNYHIKTLIKICEALKDAIETPSNQIECLGHGVGYTVREMTCIFQDINGVEFEVDVSGLACSAPHFNIFNDSKA